MHTYDSQTPPLDAPAETPAGRAGGPTVLAKPYKIGVTVFAAAAGGQPEVRFTDESPTGRGHALRKEPLDRVNSFRREMVVHTVVDLYLRNRKGDYDKSFRAVVKVLEEVCGKPRVEVPKPRTPGDAGADGRAGDVFTEPPADGPPESQAVPDEDPAGDSTVEDADDAGGGRVPDRPASAGTAFDPPVEVLCGPRGGHGKRTVFARTTPAGGEPAELGRDKFDTDDHDLARKFVALAVGGFVNAVGGLAAGNAGDDAEAELLAKVRAAADEADREELNAKAAGPAPSNAARLMDMVKGRVDAFRDPADDAYVVARRLNRDGSDGPRETMAVGGRAFRRLVRTLALEETGAGLSGEGLQAVVDTVDAVADLEGVVRPVHVRVAPAEVGGERAVVIDVGDERRRAIVVTRHGWQVTDDSPVAFLHPSGLLPLCDPADPADADLRPYLDLLNLTDAGRALVAGWLVSSLFPTGPYFILYIFGDYGSAKTTLGEACKALIDPGAAPLRKPPKDEDALTIAAQNGHVLGFDNLSELKRSMSDAMARVATGAADGRRRLFSDRDEVLMAFQKPQLLTSKVPVIREADLLDRALPVEASVIAEGDRRRKSEVTAGLDAARPAALAAVLNGVSAVLRAEAEQTPPPAELPRMADAAVRAVFAEKTLGFPPGTFLDAHRSAVGDVDANVLDGYPAILRLLEELDRRTSAPGTPNVWRDTPTKMFKDINQKLLREGQTGNWPRNAKAFSDQLRAVTPLLDKMGVKVTRSRGKERAIILTRVPQGDAAAARPAAA